MSVEKTSLERLSKNLMIEGNLPLHTSAISYMAVLDFFIEMDFPQYKGNRMDPKIRSEFIKVQVSDIMSKMSKNNIQKPRGIREFRGSSYNQRFKINNDIYKEGFLKNFDSKKLYLGPTLPHYFDTRDIGEKFSFLKILVLAVFGQVLDKILQLWGNFHKNELLCKNNEIKVCNKNFMSLIIIQLRCSIFLKV